MARHEEFLMAVKTGDLARLDALLAEDPALLEGGGENGASPVLLAFYYGQRAAAQALIERGAALNLYTAAAAGQLPRVAELIEADPAAINQHAPDGFTALGLAAFFGRPAVVEWLLANGANPNIGSNNAMRVRPIHSAAANDDHNTALASVAALLAAGAEVNVQQQGGFTPLHEAALNGKTELARLLLNHGADASLAADDGTRPADLAAKHDRREVLEVLARAAYKATTDDGQQTTDR